VGAYDPNGSLNVSGVDVNPTSDPAGYKRLLETSARERRGNAGKALSSMDNLKLSPALWAQHSSGPNAYDSFDSFFEAPNVIAEQPGVKGVKMSAPGGLKTVASTRPSMQALRGGGGGGGDMSMFSSFGGPVQDYGAPDTMARNRGLGQQHDEDLRTQNMARFGADQAHAERNLDEQDAQQRIYGGGAVAEGRIGNQIGAEHALAGAQSGAAIFNDPRVRAQRGEQLAAQLAETRARYSEPADIKAQGDRDRAATTAAGLEAAAQQRAQGLQIAQILKNQASGATDLSKQRQGAYAADRKAGDPTSPSAPPPTAAGPAKTFTIGQLAGYAADRGINRADALQQLLAQGYTLGQ
jgi:hypothetical protein